VATPADGPGAGGAPGPRAFKLKLLGLAEAGAASLPVSASVTVQVGNFKLNERPRVQDLTASLSGSDS
jgi:hypothetical protein